MINPPSSTPQPLSVVPHQPAPADRRAGTGAVRGADRLQKRLGVEVLAHLHERRRQHRKRRRTVGIQDGRAVTGRWIADLVDVHRRAVDADAVRDERAAQDVDEELRRVVHRQRVPGRRRSERHRAAQIELRAAGQAVRVERRCCARSRRLQPVVDHETAAGWIDADDRLIARRDAWRDGDANRVFVELERADAGRVAFAQVVPRPAGAQRLVLEPVVIADEAAFDAAKAERLEVLGPGIEHVRRRRRRGCRCWDRPSRPR